MADMTAKLMDSQSMGFIDQIGDIFKTLPHLPEGVVEFLVKVAPWFALVGAVLELLGSPVVALFGTIGSILTLNPMFMITTLLTIVLIIVQAVLMLMAFNPLKAREMKGWVLLFWAELAGIISSLVSVVSIFHSNSAFGSIVGALIALYFLFEIRPKFGPVSAAVEKMK